jgi:hypothetical protein
MSPLELIGTIVLLIAVYAFTVWHKLGQMSIRVKEEMSYFKDTFNERYYLLTDLVAVIRENDIKEKKAIADIVNARAVASKGKTYEEKIENDAKFTIALVRLFKLLDKYPILNEDEWYVDTKKQYDILNEKIDEIGKKYNVMAKSYNDLVTKQPSKIISNFTKSKPIPCF